ncbi:hypothetical protein AKO1_010070 [Acrasis kona]|uniref:Guanylate cyclase domain-containing protein n=1 Tax=Acrasis kona TaxID=1008807 RepID=A0AAW2ZSU4_9EUKA
MLYLTKGMGVSQTVTSPMYFGQSAGFTGSQSKASSDMRIGILAAFNEVNERYGGAGGRQLSLISTDDMYINANAANNTMSFLSNDSILALVGYVGTPPSQAAAALIQNQTIDEGASMMNYIINNVITRDVAVIYSTDDFGKSGLQGLQLAAAYSAYSIRVVCGFERLTLDVDSCVNKIATAYPYIGAISKVIKLVKNDEQRLFTNSSTIHFFVLSFNVANIPSLVGSNYTTNVHVAQQVPDALDDSTVLSRTYQKAIYKYFQTSNYSQASFEGYICGMLLAQTVQNAVYNKGDKSDVVGSVYSTGSFSISGLILGDFNNNCNQGSRSVYVPMVKPIEYGQLPNTLYTQALHYITGVRAAFNSYNAVGGYRGKKIHLEVIDDFYNAANALNNTIKLINDYKVIGLTGYFGTPSLVASSSLIISKNVSMIGSYTGAINFRNPFSRNFINLKLGFYEDVAATIQFLTGQKKVRRIAYLYQSDAISAFNTFSLVMSQMNLVAEGVATYQVKTVNITDSYRKLSIGDAEAIVMSATSEAAAAFITMVKLDPENLYPNSKDIIICTGQFTSPDIVASILASSPIDFKLFSDNIFFMNVMPMTLNSLFYKAFSEVCPYKTSTAFEGYLSGRVIVDTLTKLEDSLLTKDTLINTIYYASRMNLNDLQIGDFIDGYCNQGVKTLNLVKMNPSANNKSTDYFDLVTNVDNSFVTIPSTSCTIQTSAAPYTFVMIGSDVNKVSSSNFQFALGLKAAFSLRQGQIVAKTYDDYGLSNTTSKLLDIALNKDRALAVVGFNGDESLIFKYSSSIPFISPFSGSMALRSGLLKILNLRPSIRDEMAAIVNYVSRVETTSLIVQKYSYSSVWQSGLDAFLEASASGLQKPKNVLMFDSSDSSLHSLIQIASSSNNLVILANTSNAFKIINATSLFGLTYFVSGNTDYKLLLQNVSANAQLSSISQNILSTQAISFNIDNYQNHPSISSYVDQVNSPTFLSNNGLNPALWRQYIGSKGMEGFMTGQIIVSALAKMDAATSGKRGLNFLSDSAARDALMVNIFNSGYSSQDLSVGNIKYCNASQTSKCVNCNQLLRSVYITSSSYNGTNMERNNELYVFNFETCGVVITPANVAPIYIASFTTVSAVVLLIICVVCIIVYVKVRSHVKIGNAPKTGEMCVAFTDVQNSTLLWQQYPEEMKIALKVHNDIVRKSIRTYTGYEVKTQGDSFMVCFSNPFDAMDWAIDVQRKLLDCKDWPYELILSSYDCRTEWDEMKNVIFRGLRVRVGIHMGRAEKIIDTTTSRPDYFGTTINKAARIESCARGGQILVSFKFLQCVVESLINADSGERATNERWIMEADIQSSTDDKSSTETNSQSTPSSMMRQKKSKRRMRASFLSQRVVESHENVLYRSVGEHSLKGLAGRETLYQIMHPTLSSRVFDEKDEAPDNLELDYKQPTEYDTNGSPMSPPSPQLMTKPFLRSSSNQITPTNVTLNGFYDEQNV